MRLTPYQAKARHVQAVLTPEHVRLIRETIGSVHIKTWAAFLGVSTKTIERVRDGKRDSGTNYRNWGGPRRKRDV